MDTLSEDELIQFKEWISNKKEEAEEKIWRKKREERAKRAENISAG